MGLTWPTSSEYDELERRSRLTLSEIFYSTDTLELIGFNAGAAKEIFQRFDTRPDPEQNPMDLIDYIDGFVEKDCYQEESDRSKPFSPDEACQAMENVSLTEEFQDALTNPRFHNISGTQTLQWWIKDTLHLRYLTLCRLITSRDMPSGPVEPISELAKGLMNLPLLEDHYALYSAVTAAEINPLWENRDFEIYRVGHNAGPYMRAEDFCFYQSAFYWVQELETAEAYEAWLARRCPFSEIVIVRIQLPNPVAHILEGMELHYPVTLWNELVWHCKNRVRLPRLNSYLTHREDGGLDVLIGDISRNIAFVEGVDGVSEDNVLMINGRKATQWAFMCGYDRAIDALIKNVAYSVTPPTTLLKSSSKQD